jgi:imidazolonepropionase-like amidohydrolase
MRHYKLTLTMIGLLAGTLSAELPASARPAEASLPLPVVAAGEPGGQGLAILAAKALTVPFRGPQFVDNAVVLIEDGLITAVGPASTTPIPAGFEIIDVGERWIMPGLIDLHTHIAGTFDINDPVYATNPGLRCSTAIRPEDPKMKLAIAGGVTTVLFIPGSASNISGQGVLVKTGGHDYDTTVLRNPGSMKMAQAGNPERSVYGLARTLMTWHMRSALSRGIAYAKTWERFEKGEGPKPEKNIQFELVRALYEGRTEISVHTQIYQVVNNTLAMAADELDLPVYIDHGTFDGWKTAPRAMELGVSAILGPRNVEVPNSRIIGWAGSDPQKFQGVCAGYQEQGMEMIGFNTDAPVLPAEELQLQAAMAVRYGFEYDRLQTVRGLTIIPAITAHIDHLIGSIEPGKEADLLVLTGDPADPRVSIEAVYVKGEKVYDPKIQRRRW